MKSDAIQEAAKAAGYEIAYAEESWGRQYFGLMILVMMSERKLHEKDDFYRVADKIKEDLGRVSAELDPEGPATREAWRANIAGIYQRAGVESIYMEPIPNGYCHRACCLNKPWFRVTSKIGHVTIGWRKQVISIDWGNTVIKKSGEELFPFDKVTKSETGIHAWDEHAAVMYIRRLHEV